MPSNVIMVVRVMPRGLEVELDGLAKSIIESLKSIADGQIGIRKQPIAFGLNALDVSLVIPEDKGDAVEEALKGLTGVQTVMVQSVSLV